MIHTPKHRLPCPRTLRAHCCFSKRARLATLSRATSSNSAPCNANLFNGHHPRTPTQVSVIPTFVRLTGLASTSARHLKSLSGLHVREGDGTRDSHPRRRVFQYFKFAVSCLHLRHYFIRLLRCTAFTSGAPDKFTSFGSALRHIISPARSTAPHQVLPCSFLSLSSTGLVFLG